MAIVDVLDWEVIKVDANIPLRELIFWTAQQGLSLTQDYQFGGLGKGHWALSFKSKNAAMLFKLTFGGQ